MPQQALHNLPQTNSLPSARSLPLDAMRIVLVALVVAHHSAMAYLPEAPPVARSLRAVPHWWQAFPIVDPAKWSGFSLFVAFNDTFFMAALFLLSGLFVWSSLRRKGVNAFLRDRSLRLGKAFLFAAFAISPLAYYATYKQIGIAHPSAGFWKQWFELGSWPAGPAWFLWLLLTFDLLAAGLFRFVPERTEALATAIKNYRPAILFVLLTLFSTTCFAPMALHFGSMSWSTFGPFSVQTSRIFHYLAYFIAGLLLGAAGLESSVLHSGSVLARRWWTWLAASLVSFLLMVGLALAAMRQPPSTFWGVIVSFAFCLSCSTSTFAVLAFFVRFVNGNSRVWDALGGAAFGVYILHYAFVTWIQYWLVPVGIPAIAKATLVTSGAMLLSLGVVHAWKRLMPKAPNTVWTRPLQKR